MTCAHRILSCLPLSVFATAAAAQTTFDYPSFASVAGLTLNGAATHVAPNVRVTNNGAAETGSMWYSQLVDVDEGFETRFSFSMSPSPEGLAFVIHGAPSGASTLGGSLWGIGYGFGANTSPITNSLAIEIDAIQDTFLNDTSNNEVSIHTTGFFGNSENEGVSIGRTTPSVDLSNNTIHTLRIRYVPGVIEVYLNAIVAPILTAPFTFENGGTQLSGGSTGGLGLSGGQAWVGFTSATAFGSTGQNATITSWNWVSYQLPDACFNGNLLAGSGGPYDVLTINGSNGGFFRTMNLTVASPFTVAVGTPPSVASAPYVMFATLGLASPATVTPTPYGSACFPLVAPIDLGSFIAPHQLQVPSGLILTLPLTLQAVMAPSASNPSLVQLTNAIGMQFTFAPAPAITSVTPNSAVVGGTITISGANFSPFATVLINNVPVPTTTITPTQITLPMPAGVACASVLRVRNPDTTQAQVNFNPNPTITQQVNTQGPATGGTTYIVIGTGFAAGTTATIGGVPATVTNSASTLVTIITPPNTPGPKPVVITTPGGCTVNSTFTYL